MSNSALSASVTRILSLSGFPPELKTHDIQAAFAEWDGGFKIKWLDDTSLLIVFTDPAIAKRAYLQAIMSPPPQFSSPTSGLTAIIRPYDGSDAQQVIATVNARGGGPGHRSRASISGAPGHTRQPSRGVPWKGKQPNGNGHPLGNISTAVPIPVGREPSPTLPSIPAHPTLNSLITSTLSDLSAAPASVAPSAA